jgi:cytochrome c oxidase subunit IV
MAKAMVVFVDMIETFNWIHQQERLEIGMRWEVIMNDQSVAADLIIHNFVHFFKESVFLSYPYGQCLQPLLQQ